MFQYDALIVGAGLFGSVVANELSKNGKRVLVIDRRDHIGGNCFTDVVNGINVHKYGAHIFRTDDNAVWSYMERFCDFNNFVNSPVANYYGELFNLPFNMNTFHSLWGVNTPDEARKYIESQRVVNENPSNLEEHILDMVGVDIYEKLVKGYTEKQWGKSCRELPASVMRRIPLRFRFDNNYFDARYQGIPIGGYTSIFEQLLDSSDVRLGVDFCDMRRELFGIARIVVYTGPIDEYFGYKYGPLEWRSLRFETKEFETDNYQGVAVMNYTDPETPYTRTIEHKHFEFGSQEGTVVSWEYPADWHRGDEPYYPVEDQSNWDKYVKYLDLANAESNVVFGGRLGEYRYYDMQDTIKSALAMSKMLLRGFEGE